MTRLKAQISSVVVSPTMSESFSWGEAFRHARDTEAEGAQYFEGFFKKAKFVAEGSTPTIQNIVTSAEFVGTDDYVKGDIARGTSTEETDDTERGGFCQPAGLAKFFASTKCSVHGGFLGNNDDNGSAQVMEQSSAAVSDIADSTERESGATRQICRAWLKNNFLQLGQPCKNASCERRHVIESRSIGSLYKDYSFKGLSAVQRASIVSQVQSSAAIVADNDNSASDVTAESTTAADCAAATTRGSKSMSDLESSRKGSLSVDKKNETQEEGVNRDITDGLGVILKGALQPVGIQTLPWKAAFTHARDTEAEGAQYFEGFFKKAKFVAEGSTPTIQNIVTSAEFVGTDDYVKGDIARGTSTEETDDTERGGFCQPAGLAKFFASTKCSVHGGFLGNNDDNGSAQVMEQSSAAVSDIADSTERESGATRQICRAWLKNNFLQLGQPCKNASCERRHVIESRSIGSLYKDYSFKGLSAVQRASIVSQVQSSAAIVADNDNSASDVTAESTTAADFEAANTSYQDESSLTGDLSVDKANKKHEKSVKTDAITNMGGLQGRKSSYIVTNNIEDIENIPDVSRTTHSPLLKSASKKSRLYALYDVDDHISEPCKSSLKSLVGRCSAPWMPVHRRITY